jgi:hypothetical protein
LVDLDHDWTRVAVFIQGWVKTQPDLLYVWIAFPLQGRQETDRHSVIALVRKRRSK